MHGFCTDRLNDYRCECEKGFEGKRCDVNIDDCIAHACQNNASCVDSVQNYTCACNYGYTGKLCEIAMSRLIFISHFHIHITSDTCTTHNLCNMKS